MNCLFPQRPRWVAEKEEEEEEVIMGKGHFVEMQSQRVYYIATEDELGLLKLINAL